jgi:hypothetical protein
MSARNFLSSAFLASLLAGGIASADLSRGVMSAFKGQIVVSKAELPEGKDDKDTIAKIKAARVTELVGTAQDDVTRWTFSYTAFLNKTGATALKLEFYAGGKKFVADKSLTGVDPKSSILSGDITIDEDEGVAKGKAYVLKLVAGKDSVVATTNLLLK